MTSDGERLRKRRLWIGLSQHDVARKARINQTTVSDLERGVQTIDHTSVGVARRLAQALQWTIEELIN